MFKFFLFLERAVKIEMLLKSISIMSASTPIISEILNKAKTHISNTAEAIQSAISSNPQTLLTLHKFMEITEQKIDRHLVDKFYCSMRNDIPIYLDNELIKWCGYQGELKKQKENLLKLIKRYDIPIIRLNNDEYDKLRKDLIAQLFNGNLAENIYPEVDRSCGKNRTYNILIMPNDLQFILLKLPTSTGHIIAEHYINLSNIIKLYWQYQAAFYKLNFEELVQKTCAESRNVIYSRQQKIKQLEIDLEKKYRLGCVYFVYEAGDLSHLKIGWCYNMPARLGELQTANWRPLNIYKTIICQYPQEKEARLHELFAGHRMNGEWFRDIELLDIDAAIAE